MMSFIKRKGKGKINCLITKNKQFVSRKCKFDQGTSFSILILYFMFKKK